MLKKLCLFSLLIFAVACSSAKKKNGANDSDADISGKNDYVLELNGDSDSGRAGHLKTIYFDYRSANITTESKKMLDDNIAFLAANVAVNIQIEGHADERGSSQFNLTLGEKRAQSVYDYLTGRGVDGKKLSVISLGKEKPVSFGHDEESWSKNRRANFVVTAK